MADLFSLLVQSGNSLAAHSAALATAGNNIANANTPGYSRQTAILVANPGVTALGAGAVGTGVSLQSISISQSRDAFVERQVPSALAAAASSQSESEALQSINVLDPDLPGGLTSSLGAFYSSLRSLSQNPGDPALRQAAVGGSQALARSFNQTVTAVEEARAGLDDRVAGDITQINAAAQTVSDLNKQIQQVSSSSGQPNDLLDQRRLALDTLAKLTGGSSYQNNSGSVSFALPGGAALVTEVGAGHLSSVADPANGGHLKVQFTRADGSGPVAVDPAMMGGEVGGLLSVRDGALKSTVTALDGFAFDLATSLNTVHAAGYAADGTTGRALFTVPATAAGAASQIAVNSAVVADPRLLATATTLPVTSGDNRSLLALLATETQTLAGGANPTASLQQIVSSFGNSTAQAKALADHDAAMATHVTQLRDSSSGISIDEEMINLTKAQRAYEATAKVIETTNALLDVLMALKP